MAETRLPKSSSCPYCRGLMSPTEMSCTRCQVSVSADFGSSPLSRVPTEHQRFIEMFVLASGSLKEIAAHAGVSYPTVRNRLDKVIEALREAIAEIPNGPGIRQDQDPATSDKQRHVQDEGPPENPTAAEIIKRIS